MTGTTRENIFRLKRSNISGKIPTSSQLLVGEMAVNTQDGFLYTAIADSGGTTTIDVKQIGWDRLSTISGGTVNGPVIFNSGITVNGYFTFPVAPAAGYVLTSDIFGNASWQPPTGSGSTKLDYQSVTGATSVTSTNNSSTWVDIGSMTITARNLTISATTYTFNFSCTASLSNNAGVGNIRVVINGNPINGTNRQRTNISQTNGLNAPISTNGYVTAVKSGDIIKVQFNSPTGRWTVTDRAFTIMGILDSNIV